MPSSSRPAAFLGMTRSSLHRCLQRHGISRLPEVEGEAFQKRKFKAYPIGYFHIDIAEVRTAGGKLYLLVAIDRTSKLAFVELRETVSRRDAADFLRRLIEAVPYKIHTVLTDNATHFTDPAGNSWSPVEIREMIANQKPFRAHAFEYACALHDIDHRLTKPKHPWTNGQLERMNRTIKDATVKRSFYETHDQLRTHLRDFVRRLQLRQKVQDSQRPHPIRVHLQSMDFPAQTIQNQPAPQKPATKHLAHSPLRGGVRGRAGTENVIARERARTRKLRSLPEKVRNGSKGPFSVIKSCGYG